MRKWLIVALSLAWLGWELAAAFDGSKATWPLTQVIVTYLPAWIYLPAAVLLAVWLPYHLWSNRRRSSPGPASQVDRTSRFATSNEVTPVDGSKVMKVSRYAKAIVGALIAAGSALVPALADDKLTRGEIVVVVVAGLAALGVVWAVPNKPAAQ